MKNKFMIILSVICIPVILICFDVFNVTKIVNFSINYDWLAFIGGYISCLSTLLITWLSINNTNKIQEKSDKIALFQKRYEVYEKLRSCIMLALSSEFDRNKGLDQLSDIRESSYFLFGEDIHKYYVEIQSNYENLSKDRENNKKAIDWFIEQTEKKKIRKKFNKYLKF